MKNEKRKQRNGGSSKERNGENNRISRKRINGETEERRNQ
jgi:hypothetical protein